MTHSTFGLTQSLFVGGKKRGYLGRECRYIMRAITLKLKRFQLSNDKIDRSTEMIDHRDVQYLRTSFS